MLDAIQTASPTRKHTAQLKTFVSCRAEMLTGIGPGLYQQWAHTLSTIRKAVSLQAEISSGSPKGAA